MKIVAVYEAKVEVFVEAGEFNSWEDAAAHVSKLSLPPVKAGDVRLDLAKIWEDQGVEGELAMGHEVLGTCPMCGAGIVDGCEPGCPGSHGPGYVSTEHGHRVWCSQECRDKDPEG